MTDPSPVDVRVQGVRKEFPGHCAVDSVTLAVARGEFFSLLGPSGCGKSTLLRMICGFERPTEGRIFLGGADVTDVPPHRRDVNLVFQNYALFPHLSVSDNVAFGLRMQRVPAPERGRRIDEALAMVGLSGKAMRSPHSLSGGEQQRVAIARALVTRPRVVLLDEPLGALDLKLRRAMQEELKRLQREVGLTFLYVTHDQEEALSMSDRIAVMAGGRIEQTGTPRDVYERPSTRFTAEFIGTANLFDAQARGNGARTADGIEIALAAPAEGAITLVVRPEKLSWGPGTNTIEATVREILYTGASATVVLQRGERRLVYVGAPGAGVGESARLSWEPRDAVVLISR